MQHDACRIFYSDCDGKTVHVPLLVHLGSHFIVQCVLSLTGVERLRSHTNTTLPH